MSGPDDGPPLDVASPDVDELFGAGLSDDSPYYDPDVGASSEPYHVDGYWPPGQDSDDE
jgi:hypothetical protein